MSFQQGLSGLNAASRNLDVIGNNVANASTVGAKASRAEFADVYASSLNGSSTGATGIGVSVASVAQQFTQGDVVSTQNPLDMAINGRGFFRTSLDGAIEYTRNGQFRMDKDGFITTARGARLSGFPIDANGVVSTGSPTDMRISTADITPNPTTRATAQLNLDARTTPPTAAFDPTNSTTYNNSMSLSVYDSLGSDHVVSLYYVKDATTNAWDVYATADGNSITAAPLSISFDSAGQVVAPGGQFSLTIPPGTGTAAAQSLTFDLDLSQATQFGAPFGISQITQDGYGTGRLAGLTADGNGMLIGRYTNGQSKPQGQVALANFTNPQALSPLGNNAWSETVGSGQPTIGAPGTGTLGALQSSAVESSNVDLTAELVNMISAQRVYQANAQTIKTADQLLQTIVNLR
jgi:flagellar hook protein FlgE